MNKRELYKLCSNGDIDSFESRKKYNKKLIIKAKEISNLIDKIFEQSDNDFNTNFKNVISKIKELNIKIVNKDWENICDFNENPYEFVRAKLTIQPDEDTILKSLLGNSIRKSKLFYRTKVCIESKESCNENFPEYEFEDDYGEIKYACKLNIKIPIYTQIDKGVNILCIAEKNKKLVVLDSDIDDEDELTVPKLYSLEHSLNFDYLNENNEINHFCKIWSNFKYDILNAIYLNIPNFINTRKKEIAFLDELILENKNEKTN